MHPSATPMLLLAVVTAAALTACVEPDLADADTADETPTAPAEPVLDPARDALIAEVEAMRRTVSAAAEALEAATRAEDVATARATGRTAVDTLVDDPDRPSSAVDRALLPARTDDRGAAGDDEDVLTAVKTAARGASGPLAAAVTDLLRDPIAGDVGAWSRDPAGMVDLARTAATSSTDLPDLERAILDLPGEATRAVAWSLLVADATDLEAAVAYAQRGLAHLDLIVAAIDALETAP